MRKAVVLILALLSTALPAGGTSPAPSPVPVRGLVLRPGGGPLPGARVFLAPLLSEADDSRRELETAASSPAVSVATGPDGAFRLEAPEAGPWKVVAEAEGLAPREIRLLLVEETGLPAVELRPDARLEVRVTDEAGNPVPGARVRAAAASPSPPGPAPAWRTPVRVARTDARGAAVLPRVEGEALLVQAGAEGRPPAEAREVRTGSVRLRLPAGVSRRVRVLDATGASPLAGVLVQVGEHRWPVGRTAADGLFSIPLAPDRQEKVLLTAEDGRRLEASIGPPGKNGPEPLPLRLPALGLRKGRTGFGQVVDRMEKPVAGARVVLRPMPGARPAGPNAPLREAATGPDGRFELRDLPPGRYELTARRQGYAPLTVPGLRVPPGSGSTDLGTVILRAGVAVEGRVVDPQGRPVPEAEVRVAPAGGLPAAPGPGDEPSPPVLTGPDGSFRIEDRRPGETVDLGVRRPGYAPASAPGLRIPREQPVRIVLQPTATVEGSTVETGGAPVPGALVLILPSNPVHPTRQARSDENGLFRIEDVTPGSFEIRATAPGRQEARLANLEVRAGQELQDVEIVLAPGAVLAGRILSPTGQPVSGAEVSLLPEGSASPLLSAGATLSDEQGRYRLERLSPGTHTVKAVYEGYRPAQRRLDVREGGNTLDLTLEPGATLGGHVVDPLGAPVAGARVFLRPPPGEDPRGLPSDTSGPDGAFTLTGLADGSYRLFAEKAGFARSRDGREVAVAGTSVTGIEIQLTPGGAIAGRLLGLDFNELSRVLVRTDSGQTGQVLPDGGYRIENVEPGRQRVVAALPGGSRQAEGQVVLEPGASEARLDLDFGKGLKLTGRVLSGGQPVAGQGVLISGAEGPGRWGDTDLDGRFHFEGLDSGRYTLQVIGHRGEKRHSEEVEVAADHDMVIELNGKGH
jgi:uncharacterized GH25 family protein